MSKEGSLHLDGTSAALDFRVGLQDALAST